MFGEKCYKDYGKCVGATIGRTMLKQKKKDGKCTEKFKECGAKSWYVSV